MEKFNLDDSLGYYLGKSNSLFRVRFNETLIENGYNLNSDHWVVLIILKNNPGINQSIISKILQRDKPAVTRIIDYLENDNYVERKRDKKDRRAHNVYLTEEGGELFEKILIIIEKSQAELTNGINEEHLQIMKNTLTILIKRMTNNKKGNLKK